MSDRARPLRLKITLRVFGPNSVYGTQGSRLASASGRLPGDLAGHAAPIVEYACTLAYRTCLSWKEWMAPSRLTAFLIGLMIALATSSSAFAQALVVGGKNFTEQVLVAELTSQLLRAKGFKVDTRTGFATGGIRREQQAGLIDVYWEYTGTSLVAFNGVTDRLGPQEAYEKVKALDARKGLVWLSPSGIDNTYALAMRQAEAMTKGIASISDLAAKARGAG